MATAARPPEETERSRVAQVATAAAAAYAAAAAVRATPGPSNLVPLATVPAEAVAGATAAVTAATIAFVAELVPRDREYLEGVLRRRSRNEADIAATLGEEEDRAAEFAMRTQERLQADLPLALSIPDPVERERAVRGILNREERYMRQRAEAMTARGVAMVDRLQLRRDSPQGAYWKSDPTVIEHTAGCLVMSGGGRGRGRFWPWEVLDHVHPPRHPGCPCRLHSYGHAIARGWLRPGDVMDVRQAIAAAQGVVMETVALSPEMYELRAALIERGLTTPEKFDALAGAA